MFNRDNQIDNLLIRNTLTIKEIFELIFNNRKFYLFPIVIVLMLLIGITTLSQTGLVAFIYPI